MHERLVVTIPERSKLPQCTVPREAMWSLVDYFSSQRVRVSYQHYPTYFTVTFLNSSVEAAQQLLDDWMHLEAQSPSHADPTHHHP